MKTPEKKPGKKLEKKSEKKSEKKLEKKLAKKSDKKPEKRPARKERPKKEDVDPISALRDDLHAAERMLSGVETQPPPDDREAPLRKLLDIVEQLGGTHDVDGVLRLAAKQIIDIFEAERVFLIEFSPPDTLSFRFAVSFDGGPIAAPEGEISNAVVREVSRRRVPVLVADATKDRRFANVSSVRNLQLHSVMAAPLVALGELKGIVYADNRRLSGVFDQRSLDLLGLFGNHIGVAVHNAQLFSDLNAARVELAKAERLKAIGQIAAFVAHEVKNPLASLYLLVGMLRERWQEEAMRDRFFKVVPGELDRLNRAVMKLLGYARPTELIKAPVRLEPLMESALQLFEPRFAKMGVEVVKDFAGRTIILGDGERLREVFVNLITNALDAMEKQSVRRLEVSMGRRDSSKVHVVIRDSGTGIPPKAIRVIFDPFHTTKKDGSGMGLAYCHKLVREHAGMIWVENADGGGARFSVILPAYGA
jgi:signal transduction histidine kinase